MRNGVWVAEGAGQYGSFVLGGPAVMPEPTEEQALAVEAFRAGDDLVLQAGAGTGKTTTLSLLAFATRRRGRYLAFNKSITTEAQQLFPRTVTCSTAHSLAFRAVGHRYKQRLDRPRMTTAKLAQLMDYREEAVLGGRILRPTMLLSLAKDAVLGFCYSADPVLGTAHVPRPKGIQDDQQQAELAEIILPLAARMWDDLQDPDRGCVPFAHDYYLKMWSQTNPFIDTDFLLLDEAQDTNAALERVFLAQGAHAQLVMVGDSAQAIYGWRGARDVMTNFAGRQLALSQSFRFGSAIAQEANRWLGLAGAPIRLTGNAGVSSRIGEVSEPRAVLCRTNGGAVAEILSLLAAGRRVAMAGRADGLRRLAEAARDLQAGRRTFHRDLMLFSSWGEVQDYVEWTRTVATSCDLSKLLTNTELK